MQAKREITMHQQDNDEVNQTLTIKVMDDKGPGGANHHYHIDGPVPTFKPVDLHFQWGHMAAEGVNGITNECLLAIAEDRIAAYQHGPFPCPDNEAALNCIRKAIFHLQQRTQNRIQRGVEGLYKV